MTHSSIELDKSEAEQSMEASASSHHQVLIIGTGYGGMCMAIRLQQSGEQDFLLLERAQSVGGTWRDNHYPGAACDVPSHLYSLSFEQNPDWTRKYPPQPELKEHLESIAEKYALLEKTRFGHNVERADYDEHAKLWRVTTSQGVFTAPILVSANGALAEPRLPEIPGVEAFEGEQFHSAQWDDSVNLDGKRVGVIGTGASVIQFVPEIAPLAGSLNVYQRTAPWVLPRPDRAITQIEKTLLKRFKVLQWLYRWMLYWIHESRVPLFTGLPFAGRLFERKVKRKISREVADPDLREKLIPDYPIGCKRVLISNDWYPALGRDNVSLETNPIREIRAHSIVLDDGTEGGREQPLDVLIFGTGFHASENPMAGAFHGRNGRTLAETWVDGESAYVGTTVHGFPNLFLIAGPATGTGHTTMLFMIETQVNYIMQALRQMNDRNVCEIEVREDVERDYNVRLQEKLGKTVWATGCRSWYKHRNGKIVALWPGYSFIFRRQMRAFHLDEYLTDQCADRSVEPEAHPA